MTLPHAAKTHATHWPPRGPTRVLVVLDRPVLIELIRLTLNHGVYITRAVATATDVANALAEWQPHLAILDMDLDGAQIMALLGAKPTGGIRLPVIGLTRRSDLKNKLAAFEAGVDDILTVPFAPEELLAPGSSLLTVATQPGVGMAGSIPPNSSPAVESDGFRVLPQLEATGLDHPPR